MPNITLYINYPAGRKEKSEFCKRFGLNSYYSGKHWSKRKSDMDYLHALAAVAIGKKYKMADGVVDVIFWWDDGLDIDNHAAMGKAFLDAMKGKIIRDDSRKYVRSITHRFWDKGKIKIDVEWETQK